MTREMRWTPLLLAVAIFRTASNVSYRAANLAATYASARLIAVFGLTGAAMRRLRLAIV